jgi:ATP-dependent DNA helicase RecQ
MLERMVFYGQTGRCRWKVLLDNFGAAEGFEPCGSCDNCVRIAAAFAAAEHEREREAEAVGAEAVGAAKASADAAAGAGARAGAGVDAQDDAEAVAAPLPARGEIVSVPRYGRGIVDAVDAEGITVVFAEGSRRVFLPAFVRRQPTTRKRPPRAAKVTASAA